MESLSSDATTWLITCDNQLAPADCSNARVTSISATTSNNIFVRCEPVDPSVFNSALGRVRVSSASSNHAAVVSASRESGKDFDTYYLSVSDTGGASKLEITLFTCGDLKSVTSSGSGMIVVEDHVMGGQEVQLSVLDSGELFFTSTDALNLEIMKIELHGGGAVQVELLSPALHIANLYVTDNNSGDINIFAGNTTAQIMDSLVLETTGSGTICVETAQLQVEKFIVTANGSGDISIRTAGGGCQQEVVMASGSADLFLGDLPCRDVKVTMIGAGDIIVQATDSITGNSFGSGSIKYVGAAPRVIGGSDRRYYSSKQLAKPVGSVKEVRCHHSKVPKWSKDSFSIPLPSDLDPFYPTGTTMPPIPSSNGDQDTDSVSVKTATSSSSDGNVWDDMSKHQTTIIPIAIAAFIAALFLWRCNRKTKRNSHEYQPLVSDQAPVYI